MTGYYNPYYYSRLGNYGANYGGSYGGYPAPVATGALNTQGIFGSILGGVAGDLVGGLFGGSGSSIGSAIGSVAGGFLPFSATPGLAVAGAEPGGSNGQTSAKPLLIPYDTLDPNTRATLDLARAATKGLIDQLVKWLEKHQQSADQLSEVVQLTTRAAELFMANDLQRAYTQAQWAYYALERARGRISGLSPLFG